MEKIYTYLKPLAKVAVLILLMITIHHESKASHAAGADLTYRWLSGNTYEVTAAFYRDCGGISQPTTVTLEYGSANCNYSSSVNLPIINNGPVITYPCNSTQTTCNGGSTPGIQQWLYRGNITLPFACTDWILSYNVVARNCAINTIVQPNPCNSSTSYEPIYVEALLNNVDAPGNSSPTFSNVPISFICLGQDFNYNHGVIDIDADSLAYSVITPLTSTNTTITYLPGFSAASPVSSSPAFSINPVTGDLFMHSTALQVSVVAVKVREFRNGILIGSVIRDMQIYSRNCSPNIVPVASGINGTNAFTAYVCPGTNLCFNVNSNDDNAGQSIVMTWNSGIPAATFNISGAPFPTGQFCWTPQASDARTQPYTFTVTVRDDACPLNGLQTYSYQIYVPKVDADITSSDFSGFGVSCNNGTNGSLTVDPTGGILPFTYLWNTGQMTQTNSGLSAGTYTVTVTDSKGCSNNFTGTVSEPDQLLALITGFNEPTCNQSNGTASVGVSGGAGGNEIVWSSGQTTSSVSGLSAGTYTVTVTDDNNCTSEAQVTLQNMGNNSNTPVTASICQGSSYTLPDGNVVSDQGVYNTMLTSSTGCDSVIVTTLTVNSAITEQVSASICPGDSYMLPDGALVSNAGIYNTTLVSSGNCDSIIVTTLSLNSVYNLNFDVAICSGSLYTFPDGSVSGVAGSHTSYLTTVAGCDSIIITTLSVNPAIGSVANAEICPGSTYLLPDGQSVSLAGTYTTTLSTSLGCDSVITTHISLKTITTPTVTASGALAFCPGGSVILTSSTAANYQWLKNGVVISGATAQSYTANKSGNYKVRVSTSCGDVISGPKIVTKYGVPAVSVSPSGNVSICLYDSVLISATVAGSNPVTYQWYRNNVLIAGATTDSYYVNSNGRYKVMVTNSQTGCSTISSVTKVEKESFSATLTHDYPLVTCGPNITFTISTNAGLGTTFQWKRNNIVLQGVTGATLLTKAPGTYKAIVTSASGCTRISNAFTVVDCTDDLRMANTYKVFPNPSNGIVQIEKTDGIMGDMVAELTDLSGRVLQTINYKSAQSNSQMQFDTSGLPGGVYYLRIIEKGKVNALKIVVE